MVIGSVLLPIAHAMASPRLSGSDFRACAVMY
jgi:hypothetical protein